MDYCALVDVFTNKNMPILWFVGHKTNKVEKPVRSQQQQ